jgi:CheY-like chemotaxis protein
MRILASLSTTDATSKASDRLGCARRHRCFWPNPTQARDSAVIRAALPHRGISARTTYAKSSEEHHRSRLTGGVPIALVEGMAPTILLVEDDLDLREEVAGSLDRAGYRVATARHGGEAMAWLEREPVRPALIVLDWMLPVVDGITFLTHLASDPFLSRVPVIVISAVAETASIPRLCVERVVPKPFRLRYLIELVGSYTGHKRSVPAAGLTTAELDRLMGRFVEPR